MKFGFIAIAVSRLMKLRIKTLDGFENIPKNGPVLFVANHVGQQEPILLYSIIIAANGGQMLHAITRYKLIYGKFFQNHFGLIPLYKDRSKCIKISNQILEKKGFILIYPEGKINNNTTIKKVKTGAARIALATKTTVIPIGIQRTNPMPKTEFGHTMDIFFGRAKISIGTPIDLSAWYNSEINEKTLQEVNKAIMIPVAKLANKKYLTTD